MKIKQYKTLADLSKALGDSTRLEILVFIASGEKCVCEIFRHLKLPQNLVSHHLGILRKNNLITNRKDGKWVYYSLNRESLKRFQKSLSDIIAIK